MAGASFFALFDDIALILDDVAAMAKVAAKKTAGVLGDDLAVNAEQVSGVKANRELPVVWAVAKGSFLNKALLVPAAILISIFANWLIVPLLIMGGLFLSFEGAEKIIETVSHKTTKSEKHEALVSALSEPEVDIVQFEKDKIKGAIRTDFVLSAEIIIIALGTVANKTLMDQVLVLSVIAIVMTTGVYGLVALIVRMDDVGLAWQSLKPSNLFNKLRNKIGSGLLVFAPRLMQSLSWIGLVAMFLVGGGMLTHNLAWLHHVSEFILGLIPTANSFVTGLSSILLDGIYGIVAGLLVAGVLHLIPKKTQI
jgi:predicted DNA repair protein MutK